MTEDEKTENASTPGFKDRKGWLIAFGIIQILMGSFFLLVIPLVLVGMFASSMSGRANAMPVNSHMIALAVFFYLLLAAWFISMGIGSIKARRWARALVLISS